MGNRTLKEAIYDTLHHSAKPLKAIADEINLAQSTVTRWGLPDDDPDASGSPMPLRYLLGLTRITGNFAIIEYLCATLGGVFVKIPSGEEGDDVKTTLKAIKEAGAWVELSARTMLDGTISDDELAKLVKKGTCLQALIEQLKIIEQRREGRAA